MPKSIALKHISKCYIKPKYEVEDSKKPYILAHWDLLFLSIHYTQKGLLYPKPKHVEFDIEAFLQSLKDSLSLTLVHFYPLAGRLVMNVDDNQHQCTVHLDCNKGSQGARFIHASLDVTVSDILSSAHQNSVVHSLFDLSNREVCYDGHTLPNLSVQVTELIDGVFVGCTMNHAIADATSFWHFWNVWSEIQRAGGKPVLVSNPPVIYDRWYPEGYGPEDAVLPFTHPDQFITRYDPPQLKEKIFCFESKEIQKLKSEANADNTDHNNNISSFQALVAFVWRCIIRAYGLPLENPTHCFLLANNRSRLTPPLPPTYFGNSTTTIATTCTTVDKLLNSSLGHVAKLLNKSVKNHTGEVVIDRAKAWYKSPFVYESGAFTETSVNESVYFMSSPRLDMYGNEFAGLGKPIAVKSGFANKFSGQLTAYEGSQGPGSVDFEISLTDNLMRSLESDVEFMSVASTR